MGFNMNATWAQATALVSVNFQLLAVIAGVFLFLPAVAIYLTVPDLAAFMDPTAEPEQVAELMQGMMGEIIGWSTIAMIFQFIGYLAMVGLMGKSRPTVGEALGQGAKSLPTLIATFVIFIVAYALLALVVMIPIALLGAVIGPVAPLLGMIAIIGLTVFLMSRLSITMPAIMVEDTLNPYTALKRSWDLTKPYQWPIMGFWSLLIVAYFVISMLIFGVISLMGAMSASSTISLLIMGIVNGIMGALVAMFVAGIVVAMHQQLGGRSQEDLTETFG